MSDLSTIARRHADEVRDVVADARLPQLDTSRGGVRAVPRPVWTLVTAVVMLIAFSLPFLFGSNQPGLEEPVVATTVSGPDGVETSTVSVGPGGGFIPTGSLSQSCGWCLSVLLDDGRVLVVGLRAVEIYDPATWTFNTLVERPQASRHLVDAVLAHDGRVIGLGISGRDPSEVEIIDPRTGTFRLVELPRGEGSADFLVVLADGRILILGHAVEVEPFAPVIFDPVRETFTVTGPASFHQHIAAVLLDDGQVLVFAREGETELYDPDTDTFTPTGSMITARDGFTMTKLDDGRVLIVGGAGPNGNRLATAELYDPVTGAFTQTGSMAKSRYWHAAALLPDGRVLVVGGGDDTQATAEIYDPVTGQFTEAPPLTTFRRASTAVPLADGTVLIFGHYPGNNAMIEGGSKSAEIFTLTSIERPVGCCGENPTVISIAADIGTDLGRVSLVVPPGGLQGAIEASYHYSYGDSSGGIGQDGEWRLPGDCAEGCVLPLPDFDAGGTIEVGWEGTVTVQIGYAGTAPDEASTISISFEPGD